MGDDAAPFAQALAVAISGNGWLLKSLLNGESIEEIPINGFDEVWVFPDRVGCTRSPNQPAPPRPRPSRVPGRG